MTARIASHPITRAELTAIAAEQFGDLVKAVGDVRPSRRNRSRGIEDPATRTKIVEIVGKLVSR